MSRHKIAGGYELRLVRRPHTGGYWVRMATSGRTLGEVAPDRSAWIWATTRNAYRGDGRPGLESDGDATDTVPAHLDALGKQPTQQAACEALVTHLHATSAPALGHGPHPDVTIAAGRSAHAQHGA